MDLHGYGKIILDGTWVTIALGLVSVLMGLVLGVVLALLRMSRFAVLRALSRAYTTITRGIPELVFVLFAFFGLSILIRTVMAKFGHGEYVELSAFWVGCAALSMMFGAYASEVFRMALGEIPKGQWEAAAAIGLSPAKTFWRIIAPQVGVISLPAIGNLVLVLLKDTALVSVIGLKDLMFFAGRAAQSTQSPFTFYLIAALIYLVMTIVVTAFINQGERFGNPARRQREKMGAL